MQGESSALPAFASGSKSQSKSNSEPTSRRPWTSEEDTLLIRAVGRFGNCTGQGSSWSKISTLVGGSRTNKDCRKRWFYTLDPSFRKGRWTWEEDATLKLAYAEVGPQWREIASRIPGRNDEQVAKRWKDVLAPDLALDAPWTAEEDILLLKLFKEIGPKWTPMSDHFPGRNGIACRNRFRKYKLRPGPGPDRGMGLPAWEPVTAVRVAESVYGQDMFNVASSQTTTVIHDSNPSSNRYPVPDADANIDTFHIDFNNINSLFPPSIDEPNINHFTIPPLDQIIDVDHFPQPDPLPEPAPGFGHPSNLASDLSQEQNSILQQWLNATFGDGGGDGDGDEDDDLQWLAPIDMNPLNAGTGTGTGTGTTNAESQPEPGPFSLPVHSHTQTLPAPTGNLATPIEDAWGLLVALEGGSETLTLTAGLVRQLLADASRSYMT